MKTSDLQQQVIADAAKCVKCGLCTPRCPTYAVTGHEGESARGRIALLEAVAREQLPLSKPLTQHLNSCLTCRACEVVCPSGVPYGRLIDQGRQLLQKKKPTYIKNFFIRLLIYPLRRKFLFLLLNIYHYSGICFLLKKFNRLSRYSYALPPAKFNSHASVNADTYALFSGCIAAKMDSASVNASRALLHACGYQVVHDASLCCGALAQHAGLSEDANRVMTRTQRSYSKASLSGVLSLQSGCTITLQEHLPSQDILAFFVNDENFKKLSFVANNKKVAVHLPCSFKNILKENDVILNLLNRIKNLNYVILSAPYCCGAAGSNMLTEAKMADRLIAPILNEIEQQTAEIVLSMNIGCALHLQTHLRQTQSAIKVMHPTTFLAECCQQIQ